jgi:hypothetical protein
VICLKHEEPRPFQGELSEPLPSPGPTGGRRGVKGPVRTANLQALDELGCYLGNT